MENKQNFDQIEIQQKEKIVNVDNNRYPQCIVWTALPCITCCIPWIGHTGICTSKGIIHDFGGNKYIAVNNMTFGKPQKYVILNTDQRIDDKTWDQAIELADEDYCQMNHDLCFNNCHSHVARVLNKMNYKGYSNWTMFGVFWLTFFYGKYNNLSSLLINYSFWLIILFIIIFMNYS